eukprot:TRINITY_DN1257_c1_g3_i3.p1 TRINITY_DN1257_c1_g3~~TRINITY_DN1257_c1_g3_i3.p1  ORF type:complete len:558 (-),score=101.50 TRINITY_DN1257_c1_g3_i3:80-1720(-)
MTRKVIYLAVLVSLFALLQSAPTQATWFPANTRFGNCTEAADCDKSLVCRDGQCRHCDHDWECNEHGGHKRVCGTNRDTGRAACKHKPLFPHFDFNDELGTILAFLGSMLAAGGGTGGGGIFVPMLIVVVGFSPKEAIPLSKAMIFGGAVSNLIFNARRRHPLADRPVIDYDLALMMEPLTLGGTIIGVFFNVIMPNWVIVIALITLLTGVTYRTSQKAIATYKSEIIRPSLLAELGEWEQASDEDDFVGGEEGYYTNDSGSDGLGNGSNRREHTPLLVSRAEMGSGGTELERIVADNTRKNETGESLATILERERFTPWTKIALLVFSWIGILTISILKGGHGAPSIIGIQGCSFWYWLIVSLALPFLLSITLCAGYWLRYNHEVKSSLGYNFIDGDVRWTRRNSILYPALCSIAGVMAGLLGIGGGMIKGPLMLEVGVRPQVVSATAAFMILFTSSATTIQFLVLGLMPLDYAAWYAVIGFVASYLGQLLMMYVIQRYRKSSYIIFCIAIVIGCSTILMGSTGIGGVIRDFERGRHLGLNPLCQ